MAQEPVLRFDAVSVYFDELRALDKVTFQVERGHTVVVFGAAGSGKSVLLKTAIGLLKPQEGRVSLFGTDITDLEEEELFEIRSNVGVLFQESGLFDSLNIEENVGYPLLNQKKAGEKRSRPDPQQVHEKVRQSLRFVELEHTLEKFPSELSGGMRRRVGIARAAVTDPALTLYDSPTAGLDPITANTIMALIVKARDTRNTTSIIVTHRFQDGHIAANYCWDQGQNRMVLAPDSKIHDTTTFLVMQQGRIAFEGTEEELGASTDPYVSRFKTEVEN